MCKFGWLVIADCLLSSLRVWFGLFISIVWVVYYFFAICLVAIYAFVFGGDCGLEFLFAVLVWYLLL